MTSILYNIAAQSALKNLQATNMAMQDTQNRVSSGLKIGSAADSAGYWAIATTMKADDSALGAVSNSLGLGASAVATAYNGINSAITTAENIKTQLVNALQAGVDRTQIQANITQLQSELKNTADDSTFSGQNYLSVDSSAAGYNATASIVASYSRSSTGTTIGTIDVNVTNTKLYDANASSSGILDKTFAVGTGTSSVATLDVSTLTDSSADAAKINAMIAGVDTAISSMTTAASSLGAVQSRIKDQQSFNSSLSSSIESGVSTLVDADMTAESTKLQALQVQQSLGTQALSIANQSAQSILQLFK